MPKAKIKVNGVWYTIGGLSSGERMEILGESQQYANDLFNGISDEIAGLRQAVSDTNVYVDGAFKDGIISEAEAKAIATHLQTLATRKAELDREYSDLLVNQFLNDASRASMTSAKENYDEKYNALVTSINDAIADKIASPSESTEVDTNFDNYNDAISLLVATLKSATEQASQLRAGNSLQESMDYTDGKIAPISESLVNAWSEIDQTPTKISAALSKTTITTQYEYVHQQAVDEAKAYADVIRNTTGTYITNLQDRLAQLKTNVTNAFSDGNITSLEASDIPQYITSLSEAKDDLDNDYRTIYDNAYMSITKQDDLAFTKASLSTAYTSMINSINAAKVDTTATAEEVTDVNTKFQLFEDSIDSYQLRVLASIQLIQDNKTFELEEQSLDGEDNILIPVSSQINILNSKLEQTAESLNSTITKEVFDASVASNNAYADQLKQETDQAIVELQGSVGDTNEYIDGAFKDGIIYEAEQKKIQAYLLTLDQSKKTFDARYQEIYANSWLKDSADNPVKTDLSTAKTNYDTQYDDLVTIINNVIADGLATVDENTQVDEAFKDYNDSITLLQTVLERAIDAISQAKADSASELAKQYADNMKEEIDGQFTALNKDVEATNTYVDGAFKDGVVTETESKRISTYVNVLNESKGVFDQRYDTIYNDPYMEGTSYAGELSLRKTLYDSAYNNLISSINNAIVDGVATTIETQDVDSKFDDYNTRAKNLASSLESAINWIAQCKADTAQGNAQGYTDGRIETVNSTIEQLADQITLSVTKTTFDSTVGDIQDDLLSIRKDVTWKCDVISTNGLIFKNGDVDTALQAYVYQGKTNVTDTIDASRFIWIRDTGDTTADTAWNDANKGKKAVYVTNADVNGKTNFTCQIDDIPTT
jgi:hypothetical protein